MHLKVSFRYIPGQVVGVNAVNGTSASPITVKAENEWRALIDGSGGGGTPIEIRNASYWVIEGMQARTGDVSGDGYYDVTVAFDSYHRTIRRMLFHHSSRYYNVALLVLYKRHQRLSKSARAIGSPAMGLRRNMAT